MNHKSFIKIVEKCEVKSFIDNDPIQFCYRYNDKKDIEIAGIIASWLSYGPKDIYIPKIDYILNVIMGNKPYDYILGVSWEKYKDDYSCLYRMNTWHNFAMLCEKLRLVYLNNEDLENAVLSHFIDRTTHFKYYYQSLCDLLSGETMIQTEKSLCTSRRMNMFMRWMVRKNSQVDLGLWKGFRQENLLVSCNTNCLNRAKELGIIDLTVESISCAVRVTKYAKKLFPNDPARMDFALCECGENKMK